jgi:hypothetical protein
MPECAFWDVQNGLEPEFLAVNATFFEAAAPVASVARFGGRVHEQVGQGDQKISELDRF